MILINNDKTQTIATIERFLNTDQSYMDWMSDNFNEVFTETGLWEKYQEYNLSYTKYSTKDGWANALFHYFVYTKTDLRNFTQWVKLILEDEYGVTYSK